MKLSDAILLGSVNNKQAFGFFYLEGATCAMGAALDAVGKLNRFRQDKNFTNEREVWPWAHNTRADCPVCKLNNKVREIVAHLNNTHGWTRPQIAAWVATIEPAE